MQVMDSAVCAQLIDEVKDALGDDLNSAKALTQINQFLDKAAPTPELFQQIDDALGLGLSNRLDISDEQKQLIQQRETARSKKDWAQSDELRDQLIEQGLEINDTPNGPIWRRL